METSKINDWKTLELVNVGRQRMEELEAKNAVIREKLEQKEHDRHIEQWQPYLYRITRELPEWTHYHLEIPEREPTNYHGETGYNPVRLSLPELAPIRVYTDSFVVGYSVPRAELQLDEYGDNGWQARWIWPDYSVTTWQLQKMTNELAVACYLAAEIMPEYVAMQSEAEQRNREAAVRSEPPQEEPKPDAPSALERIADALESIAQDLAASGPY